MSIYGCMLDYTLISAEMADEDLRSFIQKIVFPQLTPEFTKQISSLPVWRAKLGCIA